MRYRDSVQDTGDVLQVFYQARGRKIWEERGPGKMQACL